MPKDFEPEIRMWVFEEMVSLSLFSLLLPILCMCCCFLAHGTFLFISQNCLYTQCGDRKLSEIINTDHENVKYLPGVKLPPNVKAVPDLQDAARGASIVIFVLPHQFLPKCT
jgi:hypothetical protein